MTAEQSGRPRIRDAGRAKVILELFTRNVARSGYAGSNFSEIAGELGISKGTIVHHYGTKDQLFAQMHDSYMERRLAEAEAIVAKLETPEKQLAGLLFAFLQYQDIDRYATVALQREIATLSTHEAMAHGRRRRADYLAVVRGVIAEGVRKNDFRALDVDLQSLLIFGASQWAWTWFEPGHRLTAMESGSQLVQLALGALLVDRRPLERLADPQGEVAATVVSLLPRADG